MVDVDKTLISDRIFLAIPLHIREVILDTGEDLFGLNLLPLGDGLQPLVAENRRLLLGVLQAVLPHVYPKVFHNLRQ